MKKGLSAIIIASALFAINGSATSSSSLSIFSIKNHILGTQTTVSSDLDTNNDSKVDIYDLIRYKQQILSSDPITTTSVYSEKTIPASTTILPPVTSTEPTTTTTVTTTTSPVITGTPTSVDSSPIVHIIYITKTGKKYHYDDTCNGGKYYESTLEEALRRGLTPCSKCVHD